MAARVRNGPAQIALDTLSRGPYTAQEARRINIRLRCKTTRTADIDVNRTLALTLTTKALNSKAFFSFALKPLTRRGQAG